MRIKYCIALSIFLLGFYHSESRQNERFEVKVKPSNDVYCFQDNKFTAIASAKDILIINNEAGVVSKTLSSHSSIVTDLHASPSSELLVSASKDKTAIIWDYKNGLKKKVLKGHKKSVIEAGFIGNDKVATISDDNTLKIWDVETGTVIKTVTDHEKGLSALATSKKFIATGDSRGRLIIRDVEDEYKISINTILNAQVTSLAIDHNDATLFVGLKNGDIFSFDLKSGQTKPKINNGNSPINDLYVASDNKHLVVSAGDCRVYQVDGMNLIKEVDKVASKVLAAAISPDGDG
ncbi:MAG: hypothetical protein R3345_03590, partial [Fulvivirga sp.]|nr:hypothetical protein [Fulvivirga sp.]